MDVPAPATVRVVPEIEITEVVADEYVNEPARDPVTVGAVTEKVESPNVLLTPLQVEKVGVPFPILKVSVTCGAAL
jgi:hypothetical protein